MNYASGTGTATLTFTYTVVSGNSSADLDYASTGALAGTIKDLAGNAAVLTLAAPGAAGSLGANKALVIDGVVPTVTGVTSTVPDGTYGAGAVIPITVTFTEPVTVTGTPRLNLATGSPGTTAVFYTSGSGTATLTFTYTVAATNDSADLQYTATNALGLNGGTIRDAVVNNATLTLPALASAASLGGSKNIVIVAGAAWMGATSTDWNTGSNWSGGVVPAAGVDVVIPDVANDPVHSAGSSTVRNLTILGGGSLTVSGGTLNVTASGSGGIATVQGGGSLTVNGGTLSINSIASPAADELVNDGLVTISSGNLTLVDDFGGTGTTNMTGGQLSIGGDWGLANVAVFNATGGLVEFTNTGVKNGADFDPTTGRNQFFDLTVDAGVNPGFDDTGGSKILVAGSFTNNGSPTFTGATTTVTFNGTGAQVVGGSTATGFRNLIVDKTAGSLTIVHDTTIGTSSSSSGTLTLQQGNLMTGANTLIVAAGGSVSRPAGTPGHVVGNLQKQINSTGSVTRTFEVGTGSDYTPVSVTISAAGGVSSNGSTNLTATSTAGDHPSLATSGIDPTRRVGRHWTLTKGGAWTFTSYSATFTFVAADVLGGANPNVFVVKRFSAGAWSSTTTGTRTATSTQATGIASFSDFAVGEPDSTPPTVTDVTSTAADGTYALGAVIPITVAFSESVVVTGTPRLTLETGASDATADYASGSGTSTLTFSYTVAAGQASSDLDYVSTAALALNGGTIKDLLANSAVLTLAAPGAAGSLGSSKAIVIDAIAPIPVLSSGAPDPTNGLIDVAVAFSEPVSGFDLGDISVGNGSAGSFAVVDGSHYTFDVMAAADGLVTVDVGAGAAIDAAGNPSTAATQLGRTYDATAPSVTLASVVASPTNSGSIHVTATVSEAVNDFTGADVWATNASVANFSGSATSYSFDLVPTGAAVSVVIPAGAVHDAAINAGSASNTLAWTYDATPPAAAIAFPADGGLYNAVTLDRCGQRHRDRHRRRRALRGRVQRPAGDRPLLERADLRQRHRVPQHSGRHDELVGSVPRHGLPGRRDLHPPRLRARRRRRTSRPPPWRPSRSTGRPASRSTRSAIPSTRPPSRASSSAAAPTPISRRSTSRSPTGRSCSRTAA